MPIIHTYQGDPPDEDEALFENALRTMAACLPELAVLGTLSLVSRGMRERAVTPIQPESLSSLSIVACDTILLSANECRIIMTAATSVRKTAA